MTEENTDRIELPVMENVIVSSSPHLHDSNSVAKIMLIVIASLIPACATGVFYFGMPALRVLVFSILSCLLIEAIWNKLAGRKASWKDGSAVLTGLLLGMNLSAGAPWWICFLGGTLAIVLGKELFGGLGYNPFNPALVARVGLLIGFPTTMTSWVSPCDAVTTATLDSVTSATPLGMAPAELIDKTDIIRDLLMGNVAGCIGETSAIALLIGGIVLIAFKIIKWHIPVSFIGTVAIFASVCHWADPETYIPPMYHLLSGGLFLGAIFMATDMVTSPMTKKGMIIFGVGCGVITCLIRFWASFPEGVSFAILFMNALVPLIDRFAAKKPFGIQEAELLQGGA